MKIAKVVLPVMLLLVCVHGGKVVNKASDDSRSIAGKGEITPLQNFPALFPFKEVFTTKEEEPFLVLATINCQSNNPTDPDFKLLEPTPSFVTLSDVFRDEDQALVLLFIQPRRGDRGTYEVKISGKVCGGSLGGATSFKLKVKKA